MTSEGLKSLVHKVQEFPYIMIMDWYHILCLIFMYLVVYGLLSSVCSESRLP